MKRSVSSLGVALLAMAGVAGAGQPGALPMGEKSAMFYFSKPVGMSSARRQEAVSFGLRLQQGSPLALQRSVPLLDLRFRAKRVFLVLGSPGRTRDVRLLLDGRPVSARIAGSDVRDSRVRVGFQRLYRLLDLPKARSGTLTVIPQPGVRGYAFTFG